jgi:hypothetical protein
MNIIQPRHITTGLQLVILNKQRKIQPVLAIPDNNQLAWVIRV